MSAIYVIDDDATTRNAIAMVLRSEGFAVRTFSSARDFLGKCEIDDLGCILTDVEMPGDMTGLDLLAEVSKIAPECPVVVMTGRGNAFRAAARALGACDYLEKPFSTDELFDAIAKAMPSSVRILAAE